MTEKIFYRDSHQKAFTATVISCEPSGKMFEVVLDRTAFFPEGGGQAADTGTLDNVRVTDVQERGESILHMTEKPLAVGSRVKGEIDWDKRFSRMQQHTGEHIVSGLIHSRFGYDNVGFHLNDEICTLDLSGALSKEELDEIEYAANEVIAANLPVEVSYPDKEQLAKMEYRSKIEIEGQVRIITIPDVDVCACCAPHMSYTGEIGLLKFIQAQNYKGGVRITMVCGFRALRDYRAKEASVKSIMRSLSAKEELIADAVERLKDECLELKGQLAQIQRKILKYRAGEVPEDEAVVCLFEQELAGNGARELMNLILDRGAGICAVFTRDTKEGYRYVLGSRSQDVRELCRSLNAAFSGRGGGKPEMTQGSVSGVEEEIREFILGAAEERK